MKNTQQKIGPHSEKRAGLLKIGFRMFQSDINNIIECMEKSEHCRSVCTTQKFEEKGGRLP